MIMSQKKNTKDKKNKRDKKNTKETKNTGDKGNTKNTEDKGVINLECVEGGRLEMGERHVVVLLHVLPRELSVVVVVDKDFKGVQVEAGAVVVVVDVVVDVFVFVVVVGGVEDTRVTTAVPPESEAVFPKITDVTLQSGCCDVIMGIIVKDVRSGSDCRRVDEVDVVAVEEWMEWMWWL